MQVESSIKPNKFEIEDLGNGKATVSFFDNIKEQEVTQEDNEESTIKYIYDMYKISINNRADLTEVLENNFESWLNFAKDCEYEQLAGEIRAKRDKLLKETDSEMCLDRMNLEVPEGTSFSSWLSFFKNIGSAITGNTAKYRQELRDITKQEGFPYNVVWPTKDEEE